MALIPLTQVEVPNFAKIEYGIAQQKKQEELQREDFLSRFEKQNGMFLAGDRDAVQQEWNAVQQAMDAVAANDNLESRRTLREAYAAYSEVAGAAMFNSKQYATELDFARNNPDKTVLYGQQLNEQLSGYANTRRSRDQILTSAQNPFQIQRIYEYDLGTVDQANSLLMDSFKIKAPSFGTTGGDYDQSAIRNWAGNVLDTRLRNDKERERVLVHYALQDGLIGYRGELRNREDIDAVNNLTPEQQDELINRYKKDSVDRFMDDVPSVYVTEYQQQKDREAKAYREQTLGIQKERAAKTAATAASKLIPESNYSFSGSNIEFTGPTPAGDDHAEHKGKSSFSASSKVDLPEDRKVSFIDPNTGVSYKTQKIMTDQEGSSYVLASYTQKDDSGVSKTVFEAIPLTQELLNSYATSDRPFIEEAISRLGAGAQTSGKTQINW